MAAPTDSRPAFRAWWLAVLAGLMVFAGRSALVFYAGSPVPFHDQWIAEASQLLVPDAQHTLTWHNFVIPHSDHLHVPTRLIAYGLFRLTGHWDMLAEMLVNNALIAAAFAYLFHQVRRTTGSRRLGVIALGFGVWLSTPLFYGNCLWGFQSSIELLILTAIVQVVATCTMESLDGRWWLAGLAGVVGAIAFGSGVMASAIAALVCLYRSRQPKAPRPALVAAFLVNLAIIFGGAIIVLRSPSLGQGGARFANIVHTLLHALSWPAMQPSWFALVLWAPAVIASLLLFMRRPPFWLPAYALAAWTVLQIVGIAAIRSVPVLALPPRYYDIFAVGVLANGLLCHGFLVCTEGRRWLRAGAILLTLTWCGWASLKGWEFARSHAIHDVPAMRGYAQGQIDLVQHYYAGGGQAALAAAEFPVRPYPEPEYLGNLLAHPAIKQALPALLTEPPPAGAPPDLLSYSWPGHGPRRYVWFYLALILFAVATAGAGALVMRRPGESKSGR